MLQKKLPPSDADPITLSLPPYTIVIPTFERGAEFARTLESIDAQTHRPDEVVIIDAAPGASTRDAIRKYESRLSIRDEPARWPSAAAQRNQGAEHVRTPLVGFFDDDMVLAPDVGERICRAFAEDKDGEIGGIAARIRGESHPAPRGLLWLYYRLQAGFSHPTYGGKLFGPAINCYPTYRENDDGLAAADWLNAGCVFYRTEIFLRERFPQFHGYSFMEDVHLSARVAKTHRLYFHAGALCQHCWGSNSLKRDLAAIARMRIVNQRKVAQDVLQLSGLRYELKLLLHRLFASVSIVRYRRGDWRRELAGTWERTR